MPSQLQHLPSHLREDQCSVLQLTMLKNPLDDVVLKGI
jgi:hypothetical protein